MVRNRKIQSPYGVDEWGAGYFAVGRDGHLRVRPWRDERAVDLVEVVRQCAAQGLAPPLLVRFPQILKSRLEQLYRAFDRAMKEFDYEGRYRSVYPLKVNPMRAVVESLVSVGRPGAFGLEVGSRAELAIALTQDLPPDAWICLNGFKDRRLVALATAFSGRSSDIVLVVERLGEIGLVVQETQRQGKCPILGLRCRLNSRGSGRWEASGGETSKFGLSSAGLLHAVDALRQEGLLEHLKVLHYHIGSQITSVRRIKDAVKEAARIYAKLCHRGARLTTLNVGGGLGVDYDGSRTPSDSSVNYTLQEFANNVVYTVGEVCAEEEVAAPDLVSESGRALAAYHALLITNCESRESDVPVDFPFAPESESLVAAAQPAPRRSPDPPRAGGVAVAPMAAAEAGEDDEVPAPVAEIEAIAAEITVKNFREYYHDAVVTRGEILTLFDLGYLTLEQRARAEQLFYQICQAALGFARQTRFVSDEFRILEKAFRQKYVTNFSVFRSLPDAWAVGQLFPILPIHRLRETPTEKAILVDLTCDSDGVIDSFVDVRDVKEVLELHAGQNGQPYLLAICLLGAYQEIIGDHHNLFGRPAEVIVSLAPGSLRVAPVSSGEKIAAIVQSAGYNPKHLRKQLEASLGPADAAAAGGPGGIWESTSYLGEDLEGFKNLD